MPAPIPPPNEAPSNDWLLDSVVVIKDAVLLCFAVGVDVTVSESNGLVEIISGIRK